MVKRTTKSIRMDVHNWLVPSCFVICLTLLGNTSSLAGPWADRAIARRTARAERADLRDRQRQPEATYDVRFPSGALPVVTPENTFRPGVIRRLTRRGISVEELGALARGGQPQQFANGQSSARPLTGNGYQAEPRSDAGSQSVLDSGKTELPPERHAGVITNDSGGPQQTVGRIETESKSVLVGAEEPVSSSVDDGPRFPGMEGQQVKTRNTPVVTHEPIELLPTPKPAK